VTHSAIPPLFRHYSAVDAGRGEKWRRSYSAAFLLPIGRRRNSRFRGGGLKMTLFRRHSARSLSRPSGQSAPPSTRPLDASSAQAWLEHPPGPKGVALRALAGSVSREPVPALRGRECPSGRQSPSCGQSLELGPGGLSGGQTMRPDSRLRGSTSAPNSLSGARCGMTAHLPRDRASVTRRSDAAT
jgi:hypothetical protein